MKPTILILALVWALTSNCKAQDTTWTKSDTKIYGSKSEKKQQDMISHVSDNRFLCRFIGFKQFYDQAISDYLQSNGYTFNSVINNPGINTYTLVKSGIYVGTKPIRVIMSFRHGKDDRITFGEIKGPLQTLAAIFLYYWPQDAVWRSSDQLKPGVVALKHSYGDLVSFKWINNEPVILITKDPNVSLSIPSETAVN